MPAIFGSGIQNEDLAILLRWRNENLVLHFSEITYRVARRIGSHNATGLWNRL